MFCPKPCYDPSIAQWQSAQSDTPRKAGGLKTVNRSKRQIPGFTTEALRTQRSFLLYRLPGDPGSGSGTGLANDKSAPPAGQPPHATQPTTAGGDRFFPGQACPVLRHGVSRPGKRSATPCTLCLSGERVLTPGTVKLRASPGKAGGLPNVLRTCPQIVLYKEGDGGFP